MVDYVSGPSGQANDNDDVAVDATAGGVVLLEANPHRKGALISNTGENPMRVTTDGSAPTPTHGKRLVGGASLSIASPYPSTEAIKAIREGAESTTANASEVT